MQDCSLPRRLSDGIVKVDHVCFDAKTGVSNSDQLFFPAWAIMMLETSITSLSFRSSELSQQI